jgi:hypothetical protein
MTIDERLVALSILEWLQGDILTARKKDGTPMTCQADFQLYLKDNIIRLQLAEIKPLQGCLGRVAGRISSEGSS